MFGLAYRDRKLYKLLKSDSEMVSEYVLENATNGSKLRVLFSVFDGVVHANAYLMDGLSEMRVGLERNKEMLLFKEACDEYDRRLKNKQI